MAPCLVLWLAMTAEAMAQVSAPRLRPPTVATCPSNQLTVYDGLVLRYRRGPDRTTIRIRTEWDTTEDVAIAHRGSGDPGRWFLIEGQPFAAADWARIETRPGRLRAGMRAAAWVCDDARNPIVDWKPPRER